MNPETQEPEKKAKGPTKRSPELTAMQKIEAVLEGLDEAARCRVMQYAASKFLPPAMPAAFPNCLGSNAVQC